MLSNQKCTQYTLQYKCIQYQSTNANKFLELIRFVFLKNMKGKPF